jgi:hypothetical protein
MQREALATLSPGSFALVLAGSLLVACSSEHDDGDAAKGGSATGATAGVGAQSSGGDGGSNGGGAGKAGSGGASAGAGAGGSAAAGPCGSDAVFFCDDFEQGTVGSSPTDPWLGNSEVTITTMEARSGTQAVAIAEGSATLDIDLNPARDVLFVRLMVWTSFAGTSEDSRVGITRVTSESHSATTDASPNLLAFHYYQDGEDALASMTAVPVMTWTCLEMAYDRTTGIFRAWANGSEASELSEPVGGPAIPGPWTTFALRNEIFHGGSGDMLMDDVALGTERIGCP